jgi:hypothetical protein
MILSKSRHQKIANQLEVSSLHYTLIKKYEEYLYSKISYQEISIQYARRLLNTSINFLLYCKNFKNTYPSMLALDGYLWIYPTQKYSLSDFTQFLSKQYSFELDITKIQKAQLHRPHRSRQILKKRLIKILQNLDDPYLKESDFFRAAIGYLHWINIPQNVYLNRRNLKKDYNDNYFVLACSNKFYIPKSFANILFNSYLIF